VTAWISDTLQLYGRVFGKAATLTQRNWPLALVLVGYFVGLLAAAILLAPLGIVGGFLRYLLWVALLSSWLALAEQVVRYGRARTADLASSFGAYFSDLLTVFFMLWLLQYARDLAPSPLVRILIWLAMFVFLNAVPELIYLGRRSGAELLAESYRFIGENWIEWFPPNVLLAVLVGAAMELPPGPFGVITATVLGLVLSYATIARGLLFLELTTSSRRAREFQRRAAGD
jgi:hypothetical protein